MRIYLKTGFYPIVYKPSCKQKELLVKTRSELEMIIPKMQFTVKITTNMMHICGAGSNV